ncbi:hypothetical protein ABBQ38_006160 [Trebouxia sp. C0009 RCD-2024]
METGNQSAAPAATSAPIFESVTLQHSVSIDHAAKELTTAGASTAINGHHIGVRAGGNAAKGVSEQGKLPMLHRVLDQAKNAPAKSDPATLSSCIDSGQTGGDMSIARHHGETTVAAPKPLDSDSTGDSSAEKVSQDGMLAMVDRSVLDSECLPLPSTATLMLSAVFDSADACKRSNEAASNPDATGACTDMLPSRSGDAAVTAAPDVHAMGGANGRGLVHPNGDSMINDYDDDTGRQPEARQPADALHQDNVKAASDCVEAADASEAGAVLLVSSGSGDGEGMPEQHDDGKGIPWQHDDGEGIPEQPDDAVDAQLPAADSIMGLQAGSGMSGQRACWYDESRPKAAAGRPAVQTAVATAAYLPACTALGCMGSARTKQLARGVAHVAHWGCRHVPFI